MFVPLSWAAIVDVLIEYHIIAYGCMVPWQSVRTVF